MKKYLIRIESTREDGAKLMELTTVYGDTPSRPFMIAGNLWNYTTPSHAAQRLEKLAKAWEKNGFIVNRIYGTVADMPMRGDEYNACMTMREWKAETQWSKQILAKHKSLYGY